MLRIVIKGEQVEEKSGKNARGEWKIREQVAFLETSDERKKIRIQLKDNAPPYKVGSYDLGEESFFVDQYGQLGLLSRVVLVPVVSSAARVAG